MQGSGEDSGVDSRVGVANVNFSMVFFVLLSGDVMIATSKQLFVGSFGSI